MRNYMYDSGWLRSEVYSIPIICVGNLSTGGTGKSPMIEYLANVLQEDFKVAILSRGYKRKTNGYLEVSTSHSAEDVGDEPLLFKQNFPEVTVAVCADRRTGIAKLQAQAEIILLDDAFQHRSVKASTNILLTSFDNLFIEDYMLPSGNLREFRTGAGRADIIIVTKCPDGVAYAKLQEIQFRMALMPHQKIYFTRIGYDDQIFGPTEAHPLSYLKDKYFTLVTGIANPKPLVEFLQKKRYKFEHLRFPDHHNFGKHDMQTIAEKEIILTTEKDYMRLKSKTDKYALYYLPIRTQFLNEQEEFFIDTVFAQIDAHKQN